MRTMTRPELAAAKAARGCPVHCACTPCCDDLYITERTELGYDPYEVDPEMLRQRLLMAARSRVQARKAAAPAASAPRGGRPARRRLPTDSQLAFIAALFDSREFSSPERAQTYALVTYPEIFMPGQLRPRPFGPAEASDLIDLLKSLPRRLTPAQSAARANNAAEGRRVEAEFEQGELYALPADDSSGAEGSVYLVERSKSSGHLYALLLEDDGSTTYAPGVIRRLDPGRKLSLEEAAAWGRRTGVCCNCRAKLTNPESVAAGLGPVCRGKFA